MTKTLGPTKVWCISPHSAQKGSFNVRSFNVLGFHLVLVSKDFSVGTNYEIYDIADGFRWLPLVITEYESTKTL